MGEDFQYYLKKAAAKVVIRESEKDKPRVGDENKTKKRRIPSRQRLGKRGRKVEEENRKNKHDTLQ